MEKVTFNRLLAHFNNKNITVTEHFRFRSYSSTEKSCFTLIYKTLEALNKKKIYGGKFFDLEKAFY